MTPIRAMPDPAVSASPGGLFYLHGRQVRQYIGNIEIVRRIYSQKRRPHHARTRRDSRDGNEGVASEARSLQVG